MLLCGTLFYFAKGVIKMIIDILLGISIVVAVGVLIWSTGFNEH